VRVIAAQFTDCLQGEAFLRTSLQLSLMKTRHVQQKS
jgi:hypothetical protein